MVTAQHKHAKEICVSLHAAVLRTLVAIEDYERAAELGSGIGPLGLDGETAANWATYEIERELAVALHLIRSMMVSCGIRRPDSSC